MLRRWMISHEPVDSYTDVRYILSSWRDKMSPDDAVAIGSVILRRLQAEQERERAAELVAVTSEFGDLAPRALLREAADLLIKNLSAAPAAQGAEIVSALKSLPAGTVQRSAFDRIRPALEPVGPCALLLKIADDVRTTEISDQLRNPACPREDWNELALALATRAGSGFARSPAREPLPDQIQVDFGALSHYLETHAPLPPPTSSGWVARVSLGLLASGLLAFGSAMYAAFRG
jgi:hypothetical protein